MYDDDLNGMELWKGIRFIDIILLFDGFYNPSSQLDPIILKEEFSESELVAILILPVCTLRK